MKVSKTTQFVISIWSNEDNLCVDAVIGIVRVIINSTCLLICLQDWIELSFLVNFQGLKGKAGLSGFPANPGAKVKLIINFKHTLLKRKESQVDKHVFIKVSEIKLNLEFMQTNFLLMSSTVLLR